MRWSSWPATKPDTSRPPNWWSMVASRLPAEGQRMGGSPTHLPVRTDWLASREEQALAPALPIVDSHHHLYDRPGSRYLLDDLLRDLHGGHNVRATVIVQARSMLRAGVPPHLQPLGETE